MFRLSAVVLGLVFSAASFAGSVSCYVDKEMRYANGRPGNDVIIIMDISSASNSVKFVQGGNRLVPGLERGTNSLVVSIGEAQNWPDNADEFPRQVRELILMDVSDLLASGKGNQTSESVQIASGERIHLRCEGKQ